MYITGICREASWDREILGADAHRTAREDAAQCIATMPLLAEQQMEVVHDLPGKRRLDRRRVRACPGECIGDFGTDAPVTEQRQQEELDGDAPAPFAGRRVRRVGENPARPRYVVRLTAELQHVLDHVFDFRRGEKSIRAEVRLIFFAAKCRIQCQHGRVVAARVWMTRADSIADGPFHIGRQQGSPGGFQIVTREAQGLVGQVRCVLVGKAFEVRAVAARATSDIDRLAQAHGLAVEANGLDDLVNRNGGQFSGRCHELTVFFIKSRASALSTGGKHPINPGAIAAVACIHAVDQAASQFSTLRPGTRPNSSVLAVTATRFSARQCAAISISLGPMVLPDSSR